MNIIDTHLHIWDIDHLDYLWLDDVPDINQTHLPSDYRDITADETVEKMVFVQCECDPAQYKAEVEWVTKQAEADPRIAGIVAWAPLEKGEAVREDLEALKQYPLLRGIRRIIQFEADVDFCLQTDFIRGVQLLADYDLSFDICIKGDQQFANTLELVKQCPEADFILDHIGKPFIQEGILDPWRDYIRELAAFPNTWCKVSGLVTEADTERWIAADLKPYLDHVLESFGFDRVCFGGDWPVVTLASTWQRWVDTLKDAVSDCSVDEQRRLFHDNAQLFYRI